MPFIVTTIHDPVALAATCRRLSLSPPQHGTIQHDDKEVSGWIVYLRGVRYPIVCDTLTGLIAYHPRDNAFSPYARIMRYIYRYYAIQAQLRQGQAGRDVGNTRARKNRHSSLVRLGA